MQKQGVSIVVASVLLIMITVIAGVLIASFIVPFVKNNLYKSTECLPYRGYFSFQQTYEYRGSQIHYNCYSKNIYGVAITANPITDRTTENVTGFLIVFSNETTSTGVKVINSMTASSNTGKVRMFNHTDKIIHVPESGGFETYVYNGTKGFTTLTVQPILSSGSICSETDSIKLEPCDASVSLAIT